MNTCEYEDRSTCLKTIIRQKHHRKIVSGIRLLTESCNTARTSSIVSAREVNKDQEDVLEQKSELPRDILMHQILARLPIKSLLRSKLVSKEWYTTVSSKEFANIHLKTCYSSLCPSSPVDCLFIQAEKDFYLFYLQEGEKVLDYSLVKLEPNFECNSLNELRLVGSCNGLVCLSDSLAGYIYVWNPIAYNWQKFSDLCLYSYNYCISWGFAYVSSIDDYKVVRIAENYDTQEISVSVFSLQTKEWKQIHDHGLDHRVSLAKTNPGVLVNDTLYWIMETRDSTRKNVVVGFNLKLEKFDEIPGLFPRSAGFHNHFLCVMGGCLSLCSSNLHKESYLSMMKQSGEVVESILLSSNSKSWSYSSLVGFTGTGKSLVVSKSWELALVDMNSSPKQYIPLVTFDEARKPYMVSYFPSLIPPFVV
ncbi:F-box/kelch-repeat protein At3g23880-like [Chenopodium quinoa]|uniref:F-box/kelch-repeat protein At3g23880-like n=1 Tax=Chenopodium quinoa TaxID=63459 RepID=UPI000B78D9F1|nr:F-box/kelch-repeat protein At3g23880-like [Chenopodium quinoa]